MNFCIRVMGVSVLLHFCSVCMAQVTPLAPTDTVLAESSQTPKTTWLGKVEGWEKYEPRTYTVKRGEGSLQVLDGGVRERISRLMLDTHSFSTIGYTQAQAPRVVSIKTTRPAGDLQAGMKWASRITYETPPPSWCPSESQASHDSTFEVGPQETHVLRIDGKDTTLSVLPVVEQGAWNRCYTGKRYQRLLWSPELQTVVAIELQTYDPTGKLHPASFDLQVKEVQRGRE